MNVGGTLTEGAFYVDGHVGTLAFANTLGTADEALVINGNLAKIRVGTDRAIHGSDFALDLSVDGDLKVFEAFGTVTGDIFARGDVRKFMVTADPVTAGTDILAGKIDILGNRSLAVRLARGSGLGGAGAGLCRSDSVAPVTGRSACPADRS